MLVGHTLIHRRSGKPELDSLPMTYPLGTAPDPPLVGLPFRELVLEVTRKGVTVSGGLAPVPVSWPWLDSGFGRVESKNPVVAGLPRPNGPAQAAGLIVVSALAEIRSITYEPLDP